MRLYTEIKKYNLHEIKLKKAQKINLLVDIQDYQLAKVQK